MNSFKIALCQHKIRESLDENLEAAASSVAKAAAAGAVIVSLPEMFLCHFVPQQMREHAQTASGSIVKALSRMAAENGVWLIGGSFPEIGSDIKSEMKNGKGKDSENQDNAAAGRQPRTVSAEAYGKRTENSENQSGTGSALYNTCPVFAPDGTLAGMYRKRFLFDVDIPGKVSSCESSVFTPGDSSLVVDAGFVKFGVALCFDIRFPELFIDMAKAGAELIFVPAAFSARTGPDHWELLNRARALDSQTFVAGADIARSEDAPFAGHGYSCVADPWADIIARAGAEEEILYADIDLTRVKEIRQNLAVLKHQP